MTEILLKMTRKASHSSIKISLPFAFDCGVVEVGTGEGVGGIWFGVWERVLVYMR